MEVIIKDMYKNVVKKYPNFCNCKVCEEDVICMALNELPTMYNTSSVGQVYGKLMELQPQLKVQVIQALVKAIEIVHENPRDNCHVRCNKQNNKITA